MSDSPIFDQLFRERSCGKSWDQFFKFPASAFRWSGCSKTGVKLTRTESSFVQYDETAKRLLEEYAYQAGGEYHARKIGTWVHADVLEANGVNYVVEGETGKTGNFGHLIQDYVSQVGRSFAEQHPLAIVTDMHTEVDENNDSATLVIEAVQPITSVMPLSERDTAEPME